VLHERREDQMIEALKGFPTKVLAFSCKGQVTKRDYETVLIPAVEEALKKPGKVRLYYQTDPDFSGIDAGAMWDDFKVGMEHLLRWERIAVVTDVDWIRHTFQAFSFLIPGVAKIFRLNEEAKAREWISEGVTR
jgi:SpoIIAA-like